MASLANRRGAQLGKLTRHGTWGYIWRVRREGFPLSEFGEACGGVGPSALSLTHRRIAERMQTDRAFRQRINRLAKNLKTPDTDESQGSRVRPEWHSGLTRIGV